MKFREMSEADLADVLFVERNAYAYPWTEGNFKDCLNGNYESWLLEAEGEIIGHGVISAAVGEAHLLNICVAKGYQGQGIGRFILHYLVKRSRDLDAMAMFLEVRESNVSALALYRSEGYEQIGMRKNYYPSINGREHAIVMSLQLALI
jgi:ribosomal-protein-alanine N-acetyltransferase